MTNHRSGLMMKMTDCVFTDNMTPEMIKEAVTLIVGRTQTECFGNVTTEAGYFLSSRQMNIKPSLGSSLYGIIEEENQAS